MHNVVSTSRWWEPKTPYLLRDSRYWRRAQRAGRRHIPARLRAGYGGIFEARDELGGAVASNEVFEGVAVRLSRFSYLISLLPNSIIEELGLRLELRSRRVRSTRPSTQLAFSLSARKDVRRATRSVR